MSFPYQNNFIKPPQLMQQKQLPPQVHIQQLQQQQLQQIPQLSQNTVQLGGGVGGVGGGGIGGGFYGGNFAPQQYPSLRQQQIPQGVIEGQFQLNPQAQAYGLQGPQQQMFYQPQQIQHQIQQHIQQPMVPQPLGQAQQGQGAVNSGGGPSTASKSNNWSKLFVKNIPDDVPDEFIEGLLGKCGKIDSWKRNKDEKGKQCDFGFVEFSAVEEAMRCIRLLNEFEILAIKLQVKPSQKTEMFLNTYRDLKNQEWQGKKDGKALYQNFDQFMARDDPKVIENINLHMQQLEEQVKKLKLKQEQEEEKKEHPRERERETKKKQYKKDLEKRGKEDIANWLKREDELKRNRKREKEKEEEKIRNRQKLLQKELDFDSEEEKIQKNRYKNYIQRKKQRQKEQDDDENERRKEKLTFVPQEPTLVREDIKPENEDPEGEELQANDVDQPQNTFFQKIILTQQQKDQEKQSRQNEGENAASNTNNVNNVFGDNEEQEEQQQQQQVEQAQEKKVEEKQVEIDLETKKKLIELAKEVPKLKDDIYKYEIDWNFIQTHELLDKKVKSYLLQKSKDYLQEEQMDFVNMILKRLHLKNKPEEVEKRVFQILEEDSEEFVLKLWRFIIFEIIKIKNGI